MSLVLKDRVRETTTVTGTNDAALLGAVVGFQSFSVVGNGNTCYYTIADQSGGNWEVGIGTYTASGSTLSRDTVLASSNGGGKTVFTSGTKDVFLTYPSEKAAYLDANGNLNIYSDGELRLNDTSGGEYVALKSPSSLSASYTLTMPVDDGTNGQALITDGSGNLSWSTAASGDVYGPASATDNAVTRFDGTTGKLIQNSGVIIDDSDNVTGVVNLTSSGSVALSSGTANGVAYLNGSKVLTTGSALTFDGTNLGVGGYVEVKSANKIYFNDSGNTNSGYINNGGTNANLSFGLGASEQMRLTSTGLGIGTSSPVSALNVAGTTGVSFAVNIKGLVTIGTQGTSGSSLFVNTPSLNSTYNSGFAVDGVYTNPGGVGTSVIRLKALGVYSGGGYDSAMAFYTTSGVTESEKMRLDSSGNLGLGVTPSAWTITPALQVKGASILSEGDNLYLSANAFYGSSAWTYKANNYATQYYQLNGQHVWRTAPSGTAGNAISFTQAMTLDASGNLGIGTSSPNANLNVNSSYNTWVSNSSTAGCHIGIGPGGATNTVFGVRWTGSNAGLAGVGFTTQIVNDTANSNAFEMYTTGVTPIVFGTNTTERMRLDASGNVGIGSSSVIGKVQVNVGDITPTTTAANMNGFVVSNGNGGNGLSFGTADTGGYNWISSGYVNSASVGRPLVTFVGGTERMRINSSGNVGIGTSSPTESLTVNTTNSKTYIGISAYNDATKRHLITADNETLRLQAIGTSSSGKFAVNTGGSERLYIDSSGNVQIATLAGTGNRAVYSTSTGVLTNSSSDRFLKENDMPISQGLDAVLAMRPISYEWIDKKKMGTQREIGFIAQEMQEIVPEVVGSNSDETLSIDYPKLIAVMAKAIQELTARVAQLEGN